MTIEYTMYLKFLQKLKTSQAKPSAVMRREENKVEFLERQFHSKKLSFVHKKGSEHSFELSFPFVYFIGVFSILKCKTLFLKTTTRSGAPNDCFL